jgi:hypothetical protein
MTPAPILRIVARRRGDRIESVEVLNRRPLAGEMLVGRTVDEARRLAPVFFSLWGRAQVEAVVAACGAARGLPRPEGEEAVHTERAVAAEAAQEHLWRLLLDWPPLFRRTAPRHRFAHLHRRLAQLRQAQDAFVVGGDLLDLVANELLSGFFRAMREPTTLAEFVALARRGGTLGATLADLIELGAHVPPEEISAPLLPVVSAAAWAEALGGMPSPAFCQAPAWQGQASETGALPRHTDTPLVAMLVAQGHRIAGRLFARVVDLGDCASRLRHPLPGDLPPMVDAAPLGPDCGLATVETAGGVLIHAVRLDGERIADYAIVSPADWNFQPGGPLSRESVGRPAGDPAEALLRLRALVLALDPCVAFDVSLQNGDSDTGETGGDA